MADIPDRTRHDPPNARPGRSNQAVEVVRSEEQLRVGTEIRVSGRAVLRKYIVTETVTQTFQVRHEEVRLDHEPLSTTTDPATGEPFADDRGVEMVLYKEVPVVQMTVVATETVRLHVGTITEHVPVSAELLKERLDVEVDRADTPTEP